MCPGRPAQIPFTWELCAQHADVLGHHPVPRPPLHGPLKGPPCLLAGHTHLLLIGGGANSFCSISSAQGASGSSLRSTPESQRHACRGNLSHPAQLIWCTCTAGSAQQPWAHAHFVQHTEQAPSCWAWRYAALHVPAPRGHRHTPTKQMREPDGAALLELVHGQPNTCPLAEFAAGIAPLLWTGAASDGPEQGAAPCLGRSQCFAVWVDRLLAPLSPPVLLHTHLTGRCQRIAAAG